jgi:hypothetical protein
VPNTPFCKHARLQRAGTSGAFHPPTGKHVGIISAAVELIGGNRCLQHASSRKSNRGSKTREFHD